MFTKMITPGEPLLALAAGEPFFASVGAVVPLQLVTPGEPFTTVGPGTVIRPLPCMPPEMGLKMRSFSINFIATR